MSTTVRRLPRPSGAPFWAGMPDRSGEFLISPIVRCPRTEERVRTTRLRLALVAAVQVAWLAASPSALSRQAPNDPTIVVEAEAALVGRQVAVNRGPTASGGAFVTRRNWRNYPPRQEPLR